MWKIAVFPSKFPCVHCGTLGFLSTQFGNHGLSVFVCFSFFLLPNDFFLFWVFGGFFFFEVLFFFLMLLIPIFIFFYFNFYLFIYLLACVGS